jgi:hypothetical protein
MKQRTQEGAVTAHDMRAVLAASGSREQIEDALAVRCSFNATNRLADAFGFSVLEQAGEELMAIADRIEPEHARIMIPSLVIDGGKAVIDGPAPLEQLVMVPALLHLPGHAEQLNSHSR